MKRLVLGLVLLSLVGCSSQPTPRVARQPLPARRNFEPHLLKSSPRRSCAITVTREQGVKGAGLNLFLDGDQIARIAAGESVTVHVAPGRHRLGVKPLFSPPVRQLLVLEKDETVKLRVIDRDDNFRFIPEGGPWLASLGRSFSLVR